MNSDKWIGQAYGKLILVGEHAVVFGEPAIGFAIDRQTTVQLIANGPRDFSDPRVLQALDSLVYDPSFGLSIQSELPVGRGLGASAAFSVALSRAVNQFRHVEPTSDALHEQVFPLEALFHGAPSGIDHALSAQGGLIWYEKGPPTVLRPIAAPRWTVVVLDSEESGDTDVLVQHVRQRGQNTPDLIKRIGQIVRSARAALNVPTKLGPLLTENHALLYELGVSTDALDALVDFALSYGALGAKLSGSGGGGVVIALTLNPERLLNACEAAQIPAFLCSVPEFT